MKTLALNSLWLLMLVLFAALCVGAKLFFWAKRRAEAVESWLYERRMT